MPINIIGMIGVAPAAQTAVHVIGGGIDPQFLASFARTHEQAGFDAVLVGYSAASAEGFQVAQFCAHRTERLKFLVAHRPGFVAPTLGRAYCGHVRQPHWGALVATYHYRRGRCRPAPRRRLGWPR